MNNVLNKIIFISAGILAFTLLDFLILIITEYSLLIFVGSNSYGIFISIIAFIQIIGIIATIKKFNAGIVVKSNFFLIIYLFLAIPFVLIILLLGLIYLEGSEIMYPGLE